MPILDVDQAENVVFLKRSMRPGFAGIDNALLYNPKTTLLFGDAKDSSRPWSPRSNPPEPLAPLARSGPLSSRSAGPMATAVLSGGAMAGEREGFAVVVYREDGGWEAGLLPDRLMNDLDGLVAAVRQQPGTAIGFVDIADEFLVALRVRGEGDAQLLLSDASAAGDWDFAASVLARIEPESKPAEDVVPIGNLDLFGDLGLPAGELVEILGDLDAYADEMLASIANEAWVSPVPWTGHWTQQARGGRDGNGGLTRCRTSPPRWRAPTTSGSRAR